jgi:hypothetical protein
MGWECREVPGQEVVECWFETHHTHTLVFVQSLADAGIITIVGNASVQVPGSHRYCVAEMLMRMNSGLNMGNLELEWDSGQVMFRVGMMVRKDRKADPRQVASLVHMATGEIDRLTPFLSELCGVSELELPLYSITDLMGRTDLLPE